MNEITIMYLKQVLERAKLLNEEQQRINENIFSVVADLEKLAKTEDETPSTIDQIVGVGDEKEQLN